MDEQSEPTSNSTHTSRTSIQEHSHTHEMLRNVPEAYLAKMLEGLKQPCIPRPPLGVNSRVNRSAQGLVTQPVPQSDRDRSNRDLTGLEILTQRIRSHTQVTYTIGTAPLCSRSTVKLSAPDMQNPAQEHNIEAQHVRFPPNTYSYACLKYMFGIMLFNFSVPIPPVTFIDL